MSNGLIYQVNGARSQTVRCESGACLNATIYADSDEVMLSETSDRGHWLITDIGSLMRFAENGPYNALTEPGPDDNIGSLTLDDGTVLLMDQRHSSGMVLTAPANIEKFNTFVLSGGLGELATATSVVDVQYA